MTNNLEDFEQPDLEPNGEHQASTGVRSNLAHAWRTRPLFKFLVLVIVVGAITAVSINLFSPRTPKDTSKIMTPPQGFTQAPGGSSSPSYNQQTEQANQHRVEDAIRTGQSAIVTPVGHENNIEDLTNPQTPKKDPLIELRNQIQEQRQEIAQMKQVQQQPPQAAQKPPQPFDDSLAQAMQKEMQKLTGQWEPHGITQVAVEKDELGASDKNGSGTGSSQTAAGSTTTSSNTSSAPSFHAPIISAGTVSYAQLLVEANSDVPGPILAQIVSGPLTGARAVGEFRVETDYLVLRFSLASLKGKDYSIDAIALDPDTTLGGMATEVDQRYFTRVLLPAAAGFVQGFGSALGQGSSSVVTNGTTTIVQQSGKGLQQGMFQGLAQAGQTMGQFFEDQANQTKPLIRVAAGTPMGLFFVSSVCNFSGCSNQSPTEYQTPQPGMPGYPGNAFPQTTSGYATYTPYGTNPYGTQPAGYSQGTPTGYGYAGTPNVPYPNPSMPYNGNALTTPGYAAPYGGGYPGTYGIGTPVINP